MRPEVSKLTDLLLGGKSFREAYMQVCEAASVDAANIEDFLKSPVYQTLGKNAMKMLQKVESASDEREEGTHKFVWPGDPKEVIEEDLDNLEYMAHVLSGLKIENFPASVGGELTKLIRSAFNGVKRGHSKLDACESSEAAGEAFTYLEYTRRALTLATDFFALLSVPWDYDYQWNNYIYDKDPGKTKNPAKRDSEGRREIDYKVPESKWRELSLVVDEALNKGESLGEALKRTTAEDATAFKKLFRALM